MSTVLGLKSDSLSDAVLCDEADRLSLLLRMQSGRNDKTCGQIAITQDASNCLMKTTVKSHLCTSYNRTQVLEPHTVHLKKKIKPQHPGGFAQLFVINIVNHSPFLG